MIRRHPFAVGALLAGAMLFVSSAAAADATTGLWPNISVPPPPPPPAPDANPDVAAATSKDAALVVGIERYDALPKIPGAADNARDWEKYFLFGRKLPAERVRLLTDQNATVEAITARAKELAAAVPEGGTLFVVFIGHGAPADGGQKGLLLGADVRPSDASFASRSLSYEQLVELTNGGKQGRTVMVLDACFSGVSNEGKTLLTSVQPVVATKLIASAKTTVFSAGTAGEYAGALPGSQRPALSYLMLGALRGWGDADGDGKVTAAEAHQYVGMVLRSLPNNHEQHPQLNTDSDVETLGPSGREKAPDLPSILSKLDTWRPPVETALEPRLRVAVTCRGTDAVGTDDGLAVYLDHSPSAAQAVGGERRWDASLGRNVVENIAFPITQGEHHVLVRIPGCEPSETTVYVTDPSGIDLRGALRSDASALVRGPAGSPNWGRIGVGFWTVHTTDKVHGGVDTANGNVTARSVFGPMAYEPHASGVMVQPALAFRWWTLGLDLGYAIGDAKQVGSIVPQIATAVDDRPTSWLRSGFRTGARFPFHSAALMLGADIGYDNVVVSDLPKGSAWGASHYIYSGGWATIDVQAFCDWPIYGGLNFEALMPGASLDNASPALGFVIGAAFQPNSTCHLERSTSYKLESGEKLGAQP